MTRPDFEVILSNRHLGWGDDVIAAAEADRDRARIAAATPMPTAADSAAAADHAAAAALSERKDWPEQ